MSSEEQEHGSYGSSESEQETKKLEDVYEKIGESFDTMCDLLLSYYLPFKLTNYSNLGVGPAQYLYWTCLSAITYFDFSEMVVIATIVPILRCEWQLDIVWETMINVSSFFFSAIGTC